MRALVVEITRISDFEKALIDFGIAASRNRAKDITHQLKAQVGGSDKLTPAFLSGTFNLMRVENTKAQHNRSRARG
jgi:hypothetical protein